ncbi:MAG: D-tyrosyl-tRNA(Tyr) deacylase [Deltaproteobacteria bacterium RBG_13_52_11]|nr:MAG: D-tyrosyl-tRNA(Tyr) deacylase [Deltaproteobacteria bacterium RBG_13_52_11]
MRAIVQRVKEARVSVEEQVIGEIKKGLLVFVGVGTGDQEADADYLAAKILQLRVFEDAEGRFNRSLLDIKGGILVVSQFTLFGDCRKGRRPSFSDAAEPQQARELYHRFVIKLQENAIPVATGEFQAHMSVELVNDGPVTLLLDSKKLF